MTLRRDVRVNDQFRFGFQKIDETADGFGSAQVFLLEADLQTASLRIRELESQNAKQKKKLHAAMNGLERLQVENKQPISRR
jgi:hypothetical protein